MGSRMNPMKGMSVPASGVWPTILGPGAVGGSVGGAIGGMVGRTLLNTFHQPLPTAELAGTAVGGATGFVAGAFSGSGILPGPGGVLIGGSAGAIAGAAAGNAITAVGKNQQSQEKMW